MKHSTLKLAALLIVIAILLTGCNLIETNQLVVLQEKRAETEKELSPIIAEYDGGTVTKFDVYPDFMSMYQLYYQYYQYGLMSTFNDDTITELVEFAAQNEISAIAIKQLFEERGLTISDEDMATAEQTIAEGWEENYNTCLENAEKGDGTEEYKNAYADMLMYAQGYTKESLSEMVMSTYREAALSESVKAEVTEVTAEELQTAYDEKVAADEAAYTENPNKIETDATNASTAATICWMPEGYRTVKHILFVPAEELKTAYIDAKTALTTANTEIASLEEELAAINAPAEETEEAEEATEATEERTAETVEAELTAKQGEIATLEADVQAAADACVADVQTKIDEAMEKLNAGEAFDAVMAEVGEDPGMQSEPAMTTGYYVSANSTKWDAAFTDGAMALTEVGTWSETPVVSGSGVHIIYYASDVASGAVAFDAVKDALEADTLETKKEDHYTEVVQAKIDSLNAVYHVENFME